LTEENDTMNDTTTATASASRPPVAGEQVHVLRSGLSIHTGEGTMLSVRAVILQRGQTITITSSMLDAHRDRHGELSGWIGIVHDEDAQVRRFGEVIARAGEAPADLKPWTRGDADWQVARDRARRDAYSRPEGERAAALAAVDAEYGPAANTSTETARYREHFTERQAREQSERIRRGIVDGTR